MSQPATSMKLRGAQGELYETDGRMTFDRPIFFLLLLALPIVWLAAKSLRGTSRGAFALKAAVFVALVIALAGPRARLPIRRVAVTLVADTSASMPRDSIARSEMLLRDLARSNSGAELKLVTFAERAKLYSVPSDPRQIVIPDEIGNGAGMETNLEGAMDLALSTLPSQGARRMVIVTDGNATRGDALAAALRARASGVSVSTVPSGGTSRLPLELTSVSAPAEIFSGERFTVSLGLESAAPLPVRISIESAGRKVADAQVLLKAGANSTALDARILESGVQGIDVIVEADGFRETVFSQAIAVRKPRVLYIAGEDKPSEPLLATLHDAQVDVQTASAFPVDQSQSNWDAVVLDNYPDGALPPAEGEAIGSYVSAGGGLLFVAGDKNARLSREPETPLEKVLPVRGDPNPAPDQPTALMLVLDKSLSMDGAKIAMVRQAARASVAALRPIDKVGLIAFDKEFRWVVPLGPIGDAPGIEAQIESIMASGGTRIYPAMQAAYDAIHSEQATRKHIILLTDGMSPPGDLPQLEQDAAANRITISTIGVGDDVDRDFLQGIADATNGKSYFIEDPHRITEIVNDETKDLESSEIVERPVRAVSVRPMEFTDGVDFTHAPKLLGFLKTKARPGSETILRTDTGEPLLVRWQFGLGRAAAFLSDSRPRWSAQWVSWPSYGVFWPQLVRAMSRRDEPVRAGVHFAADGAEAVVSYDVTAGPDHAATAALRASGPVKAVVTAPDGTSRQVALRETAPGHYEATIQADQTGLYRVTGTNPSSSLPGIGFVRESDELKPQAVNVPLLAEIVRVTGGAMNPTVAQLLDVRGDYGRESQPLWPYWLVLALLLNFVELALRKGHFDRAAAWMHSLRRAPRIAHTQHG